ncbi:MAG TPA: hypothetical protein H9830_15735 [Candidatus Agrococcus pullicola]|uniref:Uncharacterized protein n=1 Tax=Candidatus Agrococcus pullicola TaxID=2838429 RepID=A0A9D1YXU0_9MICO|nr:hypothetical protein [Candidatus Agrococcus pullicola]
MTRRTRDVVFILLVSFGLGGCAAAAGNNTSAAPAGGSIELAVSETCDADSDSQCVPVGSEHVVRPAVFETAAVEDAVASSGGTQNAVDVTFTDKGADTLNDLTIQASGGNANARLLVKVGDEIVAAVTVEEPLGGDHVTLGRSADDHPDAVIELIQGN